MDCGDWIQFGFWSDVQQDLEGSRHISKCYQYEKGNSLLIKFQSTCDKLVPRSLSWIQIQNGYHLVWRFLALPPVEWFGLKY